MILSFALKLMGVQDSFGLFIRFCANLDLPGHTCHRKRATRAVQNIGRALEQHLCSTLGLFALLSHSGALGQKSSTADGFKDLVAFFVSG